MKKFIYDILNVKGFLLIILFYTFAFCLQIVNTDFVNNDKVWYEHLAQKEDQKHNDEYDQYIADFEEDLKGIDLPEEDNAYGWDYFLMDSTMVLAPFMIVCLGLATFIFIGFQFVEDFKSIRFSTIFKSSLLAYLVFFIKDIINAIWFLAIKSNYKFEDIKSFNKELSFSVRDWIGNVDKSSWYFDLLKDLNLYLLLYLLLIPFFLKIASTIPYRKLMLSMFIPILCGFVLYESLMIYLTI
ncbi:hypothetical protein EV201_2939 [Ancylomarina subtilis]|uniref:Yip1 domain-containing protein n=1 Tax=Ancylomarina subtilis TaxID=1639035 RepID=A0A4Q7VAU5_9BACT|nr:hypothetical protein [Ancylomarina subtilis]RZT92463.1 hypothetical protein EV201_2939 [Ancylomarina subtilis]